MSVRLYDRKEVVLKYQFTKVLLSLKEHVEPMRKNNVFQMNSVLLMALMKFL